MHASVGSGAWVRVVIVLWRVAGRAGLFVFTLPAPALGSMVALLLVFAWQRSLWADIRGQIEAYARRLATTD